MICAVSGYDSVFSIYIHMTVVSTNFNLGRPIPALTAVSLALTEIQQSEE